MILKQVLRPRRLVREHFFAGVLVILPLGVIAWLALSLLETLWRLPNLLPEFLWPANIFPNPIVGQFFHFLFMLAGLAVLILGTSFLGWISKRVIGRKMLEYVGEIIQRIPVLRSIYGALDQLLRTFAAQGNQQFNRVVWVEYPRRDCWSLAFVTGAARGKNLPEKHINVFIPTTPNPTSGFYLIVPENEVRDAAMSVEEAFKTLISLGIAQGGK